MIFHGLKVVLLGFILSVGMLLAPVLANAAEKIVDIRIEGNRYVESGAVLSKIKSKVGQALSRKQLSRDVRHLFATGYFSDVYTEGERVAAGIKLIFVVQENPVIAHVRFAGNEEISKKKLKPKMKMAPGLILSPNTERQDSNMIRKAYLKKGYYQMGVDIETTILDDGRVDVLVKVTEGVVTRIKDIRFVGNTSFTDAELLQPLASRISGLGSWFTSRDVFDRDRFGADAQMLRQFYQDHGHLDARVESSRLMLSPDKESFYLAMSLYEGPAFTISDIELQGDIIPSQEALMKEVKLEKGDLYAVDKLRQSIQGLTERVGDEGFAFVSVTPLFHRNIENNTLVVSFDIEKGREVYVERIEISGNSKTKDHVIRRELRQHEGERYHASHVRRSKERLRRIRYIKDVRISTPRGSADDKVNMNIVVEEGKSGTFSAGVTYSQLQQIAFTGKVSEQNLFGEGYQTNVSADLGGVTTNYSVSLMDPYFLNEDVSASINLFKTQSNLQSYTAYKQSSEGGGFGFGFALNEYSRYSVNYKLSTTTLADVPLTSSLILRSQEGTFSTGELTQSLSYDSRNRTLAASDGGLYSVSVGYAGVGGDEKFYELGLSSRTYVPLSDTFTLSTNLQLGSIHGYGGRDEPLYRRYSLGGVGSLRAYDNFGVSLRDPTTLEIMGGQYKSTVSIDVLFPLPYMATAGFRGAFFIDTGTVWGNSGSVSEKFSLARLRGSYGFGIEWTSPIGPITMTWGIPVNQQAGDLTNRFEFAVGRGF